MREVARVMPMEIVGDLKRHEGCPMTQSRVRILVVDDERNIDERNIRKNLGMVLEAKGYKVDTSGNGDDALRRIKDEYYDLDKADVVICIGYDMVEYHP
jgi:CheY-like chemotaxis protein